MAVGVLATVQSPAGNTIRAYVEAGQLKVALDTAAAYVLVSSGVKTADMFQWPTLQLQIEYITGSSTLNARRSKTISPSAAVDWETVAP